MEIFWPLSRKRPVTSYTSPAGQSGVDLNKIPVTVFWQMDFPLFERCQNMPKKKKKKDEENSENWKERKMRP